MTKRQIRGTRLIEEPTGKFIRLVADSQLRLSALRTILEPDIHVESSLLGDEMKNSDRFDGLIVHASLSNVNAIVAIRKLTAQYRTVEKRIFLVDNLSHLASAQAYALGATHVLLSEAAPSEFRKHFEDLLPQDSSRTPSSPIDLAMTDSARQLSSMFIAVQGGCSIDLAGLQRSGDLMIDGIAEHGLTSWLDTVRKHHEGTYQHCLLVAGVLVDFGISLNARRDDIRKLHLAATLHDIGKARIPLALLDKPGRLNATERSTIETHSAIGFEILKNDPVVPADVLDAVRHHHEYLDGTGYPDRLASNDISDTVRMLTISDIFAALIEDRRYKPPMSRQQAYGILQEMSSKLELPLVRAFRRVALDR